MAERRVVARAEWRWVLIAALVALAIVNVPYLAGGSSERPERVFGGCILLVDDCYSYLAKMRQGAEGAWLFHLAYTPEPHRGTLFFPFHLLLGKVAALLPGSDLTVRLVWVYHAARVIFGLGLLLTVYRFLAACTERVAVRWLAWLMVTFGGGLGWLLIVFGQSNWLGSPPLDFYLPEGFAFLVLFGFPHLALAQSLLLWGILSLSKAWGTNTQSGTPDTQHVTRNTNYELRITHLKWAILSGLLWLAMGLIVPFYVAVAWAVMGAAWVVLGLRKRQTALREGGLAGVAVLVSAPIVAYNAWIFASDPVYATWAAQNRILSPHPLHYLAAYGIPLVLAAFAVRSAWHEKGLGWLALAWMGVVPVLVYLPFNLQRRLVAGVQVPLSLLAAWGAVQLGHSRRRWLAVALLATLLPTSLVLVTGSSAWMYRDASEIAALDWLAGQVQADDVILTAYDTGNYLPVRVGAKVFLGHGLETVEADQKESLVTHFFDAATDDAWRQQLLAQYNVDYVFWGPAERALGGFDAGQAAYLRQVYDAEGYAVFKVER
jgi:hypothetical protein